MAGMDNRPQAGTNMIMKETTVHDKLVMALGQVLQEQRAKLSLSQHDLAKTSEFHRSYISDVERGYRNISLKNLNRLALALQTSASHVLAVAEEKMAQVQQLNV
jgi:transcriptional regulator with XRE-family HTH domain